MHRNADYTTLITWGALRTLLTIKLEDIVYIGTQITLL